MGTPDSLDVESIRQRDMDWRRLVWKNGDEAIVREFNAAGEDRRALLAEVERLTRDRDTARSNERACIRDYIESAKSEVERLSSRESKCLVAGCPNPPLQAAFCEGHNALRNE